MKHLTGSDAVRRCRTCAIFALVIAVGILAVGLTFLFVRQLIPVKTEATLTIRSGEWVEESPDNQIGLTQIILDEKVQNLGQLEEEDSNGFTYAEEYDDYGSDPGEQGKPMWLSLRMPAVKKIELIFASNVSSGSVIVDYNGHQQEYLLYSKEAGAKTVTLEGAKNHGPLNMILATGCGGVIAWAALFFLLLHRGTTAKRVCVFIVLFVLLWGVRRVLSALI